MLEQILIHVILSLTKGIENGMEIKRNSYRIQSKQWIF